MTKASDKVELALRRMVLNHRFDAVLASLLKYEETETVETMATDGETCFFNPKFVESCTVDETIGVLAHEDRHCIGKHHLRGSDKDHDTWNEATDLRINFDLRQEGYVLPDGHLYDAKYATWTAEEIYAELHDQKQKRSQQPQAGQNGQQQQAKTPGKGKPQRPAEAGKGQTPVSGSGNQNGQPQQPQGGASGRRIGDILPAPADKHQQQNTKWEQAARTALAAAGKEAGNLPAGLQRIAKDLDRPRIDYISILQQFIDQSCSKEPTWSRPNRRYIGNGLYLPGMTPNALHRLVFMPDFSGSIHDARLKEFRGIIQDALDSGVADIINVVYWDTEVKSVQEFEVGDQVVLSSTGGGGTSFAKPIKFVDETYQDASAILVLSDLHCNNWGERPSSPIIFAGYCRLEEFNKRSVSIPYGEAIRFGD